MTQRNVDAVEAMGNALVESHSQDLAGMLLQMLTYVMETEIEARCGAGYGERSDERENARNGYRPRPLETRVGGLNLQIPKLRRGSYLPSFLEPRRRWEKAFVNVVAEAYVKGVSTRRVEDLIEAMGAKGISRSEVSRMSKVLDAQVTEFRERRLDNEYPYLWLDALYIKVREGGRIVSKAVLVAHGVNSDGYREVLGVEVAPGEMEPAWRRFLEGLVSRGMRGVKLVISDAHTGLKAAVRAVLNATSWQRCIAHFSRNVLCHVSAAAKSFVAPVISNIFAQPDEASAREAVSKALKVLDERCAAAAAVLREGEDDILAHMAFPEAHWRQLRSTNPLERLNKEIRRRTNVVGIFPNDASIIRLVGMLLVEQNDEWAVGRRYFSLSSMALLNTASDTAAPAITDESA